MDTTKCDPPIDHALPEPSSPREVASLPIWIAPALLAGLVAICVMIALVGWLAFTPTPTRAVAAAGRVPVEPPAVTPVPTPAPTPTEHPEEVTIAPPQPTLIVTPPPQESPDVQRRMPTGRDDSVPAAPLAVAQPMQMDPPPAYQSPGLIAPLQWTAEPPKAGALHLIMPLEIARVDNAAIPHTLRRLPFPDGPPHKLKLAVTPVAHDDVGSVLTRMGDGYTFTRLRKDTMFAAETLAKYDVVFLTCADVYARDLQAAGALRKFVADGGTLYASDLYGDLLLAAFPEFRAMLPLAPGIPQTVEASVTDSALRSHLGRSKIPLTFEAPNWRPAAFEPAKVTVCLKGTYRNTLGQTLSVPLLVKFRVQKGTVIFTSFHHTKNDSAIVQMLLDYLVFASVNARNEARIRELMQRSGFPIRDLRPAVVSLNTPLEGTHQHPGGNLQFALGFEDLGAKLKLTVRSPAGPTIEHTDRRLYAIEMRNAPPGVWTYRLTPTELPYENFPITLAVGSAN